MPRKTGSDIGILKIVQELKEVDVAAISRRMVVSEKYAEGLISALVEGGHLQEESKGEERKVYKLTREGERVLNPYKESVREKYIHA